MTHALTEPPSPSPDHRFWASVIVAMVLAGLNVVQATTGGTPVPTFPVAPPVCITPAPAGPVPHPPVIYDEDGQPANEDDSP